MLISHRRTCSTWNTFPVSAPPIPWHYSHYNDVTMGSISGVSNHQPHHCLLSRLFGRRSKKTSKLRVTGLCAGNSPEIGEFPAQMASYVENISIWWRHHMCNGLEAYTFQTTATSPRGKWVNYISTIMWWIMIIVQNNHKFVLLKQHS